MPNDLIYSYDGSFEGWLCCVYTSFANQERPVDINSLKARQPSLLGGMQIATDFDKAEKVKASILKNFGPNFDTHISWTTANKDKLDLLEFMQTAFLSNLAQKELHMLDFIYLAHTEGARVMGMLTNDTVHLLKKAVQQTTHEAHKYSGFVRFAVYASVMFAQIAPKSRVLPLLAHHFAIRFGNEKFIIYDQTHHEMVAYAKGKFVFSYDIEVTPPPPTEAELHYRKLWRMYYDTIAIEQRYNPKCRMTLMPKRYWENMTEFQADKASITKIEPATTRKSLDFTCNND